MLLSATVALAQKGADSPEALLAAMQKAAENRDIDSLVRMVAPSEMPLLALQTDIGADMVADPSGDEHVKTLAKKIEKLRKKYGVVNKPDPHPMVVDSSTTQAELDAHMRKRAQDLYGNIDVTGYVAELTSLILSLPQLANQPFMPLGKAGKIQVDGDHASVKVGDEEVKMLRENGRWYLARPGS
ncbi:MAG: hypothetical protein WBX15_20835 [Thermoanaerobaculia bacterium]